MKTAIIFSGGLDSTVLSYKIKQEGEIELLTFDYGQRHKKEISSAKLIAQELGVNHHIVDISSITKLLKGSSLTDLTVDVPLKAYDKETMSLTVVPNRNAIMLSIAWGFALSHGFNQIAFGAHAGDHYIYPDCRPSFRNALEVALRLGTETNINIIAPFLTYSKGMIVKEGELLNVPFNKTWSCYKGEDLHCGECGTCLARKQAFSEAGIKDKTIYKV